MEEDIPEEEWIKLVAEAKEAGISEEVYSNNILINRFPKQEWLK